MKANNTTSKGFSQFIKSFRGMSIMVLFFGIIFGCISIYASSANKGPSGEDKNGKFYEYFSNITKSPDVSITNPYFTGFGTGFKSEYNDGNTFVKSYLATLSGSSTDIVTGFDGSGEIQRTSIEVFMRAWLGSFGVNPTPNSAIIGFSNTTGYPIYSREVGYWNSISTGINYTGGVQIGESAVPGSLEVVGGNITVNNIVPSNDDDLVTKSYIDSYLRDTCIRFLGTWDASMGKCSKSGGGGGGGGGGSSSNGGFTTIWRVGTPGYGNGNNEVSFSILGYGSVIDWGDGTIITPSSTVVSHTYLTPGDYTIKITGITGFRASANWNGGKLISVVDWGGIAWSDMNSMFMDATNLTSIPTNPPDLSNVTSMINMFKGATAFNQPIGSWNVGNVTTMNNMFEGATAFNQPIGSWNTTNVRYMNNMFNGTTAFNQPIGSWNIGKVQEMEGMFYSAARFNQDISSWCVSKIWSKPFNFDKFANAGFINNTAKQPKWGTCSSVTIPTCDDGIKNGTETGVDCGGSCSACITVESKCTVHHYGGILGYEVKTLFPKFTNMYGTTDTLMIDNWSTTLKPNSCEGQGLAYCHNILYTGTSPDLQGKIMGFKCESKYYAECGSAPATCRDGEVTEDNGNYACGQYHEWKCVTSDDTRQCFNKNSDC